jgi:putative ABC transport system permease protein
MNMKVPFGMYAALYAGVLILYFIINTVLVGQIRKIVPAQVMKNRE